MSLSTVFSLLTSTSSSTSQSEKTTEDEDIINITSISSTKSGATFPTTTSPTNIITSGSTGSPTTGESYQSSSSTAGESNLTTFAEKSTSSSLLDEDYYFNETINIKNNIGSYNYSSNSSQNITFPEINSSTPTNELDFENIEDDASLDLFSNSSSTTDINGLENLDKVETNDETTFVPLFYFMVTILLGVYVYLYFLHRHLKAKALRGQDDDSSSAKRHEERLTRGGCQYDYEGDMETDYGPQQQ